MATACRIESPTDLDDGQTSEESLSEESDAREIESDTDHDDGNGENTAPTTEGLWMTMLGEDFGPTMIPFIGVPGPKHPPQETHPKPLDYVKLFIDHALLDILVTETNRYAEQWINSHQQYLADHPHSIIHSQWISKGQTNDEEMFAFISVCINMGLIQKSTIESYWNTSNPSQATPWFSEHFNRERFTLLMKFLHFSDNTFQPPIDDDNYKTYKIKPLVNHFRRRFQTYYRPHQNISIDESMIGYRGKTPHLRQFMPNKRHSRFRVKLWCLCDSENGYLCQFDVYKGVVDSRNRNAEGATHTLVMKLMTDANLLNLGHHLGLDNYFTSPKLVMDLCSKFIRNQKTMCC